MAERGVQLALMRFSIYLALLLRGREGWGRGCVVRTACHPRAGGGSTHIQTHTPPASTTDQYRPPPNPLRKKEREKQVVTISHCCSCSPANSCHLCKIWCRKLPREGEPRSCCCQPCRYGQNSPLPPHPVPRRGGSEL
jgi:hypothetical protein